MAHLIAQVDMDEPTSGTPATADAARTSPRAAALEAGLAAATGEQPARTHTGSLIRVEVTLPAQLSETRRRAVLTALADADHHGQATTPDGITVWGEIRDTATHVCDHCQQPTTDAVPITEHGGSGAGRTVYTCPRDAWRYERRGRMATGQDLRNP